MKSKTIDIRRPAYAMATKDGNSAEIIMYGDIVEQHPVDWWTDEPVEGQYITLDDFLADLDSLAGCKDITIRMNSYGGDAGVSNTIHNRLRDLARGGTKLTCIVDGVAMSGGSLIMCACDMVKANPSSLIMIHKCLTALYGTYNADELREAARQNDAWDKMQVEIYKAKTGLSDTVLMHMMSDTTYMTGREAFEKGFVDTVIEDAEPVNIAASADGRSLYIRGRRLPLAPGLFAPDNIPTVDTATESSAVQTNISKNQPEESGEEGGDDLMTAQELREKYPNEIAEVEAEARRTVDTSEAVRAAVAAERDRLRAIDDVAGLFDASQVREAKYGETPVTAQEMAYRAAQKAAKEGGAFMAALNKDAAASGAADVTATPPASDGAPATAEAKREQAKAEVKAMFAEN